VQIILVDDHPMVRHSLGAVLTMDGHQVDAAPDCQAAREMLRARHYDLMLVDYHLPDCTGVELLDTAESLLPARVVLLSGVTDTEEALFALEHSPARAFFFKDIDVDDLRTALEAVRALDDDGSTWVWRADRRALVPSAEAFPRETTLTPREREVFMLMRQGLLDKQIADHLHKSIHTIRVQIRSIRRKRGASRRAEIEG
jgi:DNA-binding NarL/FixJ family response regulator